MKLIKSDLKYLGAFRVTYANNPDGRSGFSSARIAVNPATNTFFMSGNPFNTVAEYAIPDPVISDNVNDLNSTGDPIQPFTSWLNRITHNTAGNNIGSCGPMKVIDGKLVIAVFDTYDASAIKDVDNFVRIEDPSNLATSGVTGYFGIDEKMFAAGWLSPIPTELQSSLGGDLLSGSARMASVNGRWSMGPSAYSVSKQDVLTALPSDIIESTKLQKYTLDNRLWKHIPSATNWNYAGGHTSDDPNFLPWLETPTKHANYNWRPDGVLTNDVWTESSRASFGFIPPNTMSYICLGRVGGIRTGIKYKIYPINGGPQPSSGEHPFDANDRDNFIWFFDVQDLIDHKNGLTEEHDAFPYDYGKITLPFEYLVPTYTEGTGLASADYDPVSNKLYIALNRVDTGTMPIILVYQLLFDRPSDPENVTGFPNLTWSAPTTRVDGSALSGGEIAGYEVVATIGKPSNQRTQVFSTTSTSLTLDPIYETCRITVTAIDSDGKRSAPVWNGINPTGRLFAPHNGGIRQ